MSDDGRYVAFYSSADNLVFPDVNLINDVFVRDLRNGVTHLASMNSRGLRAIAPPVPGTSGSYSPAMNASGRFVAFESDAINLVDGDTNLAIDIFVRDLKLHRTERVSVATGGEQAKCLRSCWSSSASISANGRYVAFSSDAPNLVADDTNNARDIFVHDRKTGETERVSVSSSGAEGNASTGYRPAISPDGRYVGFNSNANNLVSSDTNLSTDMFIHDRKSGSTDIVLRSRTVFSSSLYSLSNGGRYVTFQSVDDTLVPNDSQPVPNPDVFINYDIFVLDRETGRIELVSTTSHGEQSNEGSCCAPSITPDGRYVVFESGASNLHPGDTGVRTDIPPGRGDGDVFIHDRKTGATSMLNAAPNGEQGKCGSSDSIFSGDVATYPTITPDGRFGAFSSCAINLVADLWEQEFESHWDQVFVVDRGYALGAGLGGEPPDQPDDRICIAPDVCNPPRSAVSFPDAVDDVDDTLTSRGANLYSTSLAYRPQYQDLFAVIELEHMPPVVPGLSPILYGLRFEVNDRSYEVRATSRLGGTFGLFDCTTSTQMCTKVADLRGGYGTTGMRVVFSVPLQEIGIEKGGELSDIRVFSALGTFETGAVSTLDKLRYPKS